MRCFIILSAPSSQKLGGEKAALRHPGGENPGLLPAAVELGRVAGVGSDVFSKSC